MAFNLVLQQGSLQEFEDEVVARKYVQSHFIKWLAPEFEDYYGFSLAWKIRVW